MISQTAEYALRAVVFLAAHSGAAQTAQQISEGTKVPAGYLSKVMQNLSRCGLVHSQRGLHGGFTLASAPETLTVLDVVQAVDPIHRIRTCPLGIKDHIRLCPLHRRLDDAMSMVETALRQSTIAELLAESDQERGVPVPLCAWPEEADPSSKKMGSLRTVPPR